MIREEERWEGRDKEEGERRRGGGEEEERGKEEREIMEMDLSINNGRKEGGRTREMNWSTMPHTQVTFIAQQSLRCGHWIAHQIQ